jgi:SPP1 gp7 family putative phage head morphogenesis protein
VPTVDPYTEADILDWEKRLSDAVVHALHLVCNEAADQIGQIVVAADGPPGQPYVSVDDLASMPGLWTGQVQNLIMPLVGEIYQDAAGKTHAKMVDLVGPQVPSIGSQVAEEYLAGAANRWEFIGGDVWENARAELLDGFQQGESIPKLAARVRGAANISQRRATALARTEVVSASNAGSFASAQSSELDMTKQWLATEDERTRPTHRTADGQSRPLNEPFTVGVASLMYPGDPTGPAEETNNCRCTIVYDIPKATVKAKKAAAKPAPPPPAALEAAKQRQADIDRHRPNAEALADIDTVIDRIIFDGELTPENHEALIEMINATVEQDGVTRDVFGAWGEVGDFVTLNQVIDLRDQIIRLERAHDLHRVDDAFAGQWTTFDPSKHTLVGGTDLKPGDSVQVLRVGYIYRRQGEDILLHKSDVGPIKLPDTGMEPVQAVDLQFDLPAEALEMRRSYQVRLTTARKDDNALMSPPLALPDQAGLTRQEIEALDHYGSLGYMNINDGLRTARGNVQGIVSTRVREEIGHIDAAMARSSLDAEIVTYRGFPNGREILGPGWHDQDMTGLEWVDNGYSSTTSDTAVAEGFSIMGTRDSVMLRIITPRGVNAIQISGRDFESEVLLQRGLRFRVVNDSGPPRPGELRRLDVEVVV